MLEQLTPNQNMFYAGAMYNNVQKPLMNQALLPEERAALTNRGGAFNSRVAQEDIYRTYCTHKENGHPVLQMNGDGTFTCPLCQETFLEVSLEAEHVKEITNEMTSILQMIKTCYFDLPVETIRQFFPFMALLKKVPDLAAEAVRNLAKYEQGSMIQGGSQPYGFNAFNSLIGGNPAAMGGYMPTQGQAMFNPATGQYQPTPMYNQPVQPMYDPNSGQMVMSPMGQAYNPAQMGMMPSTPNYQPVGGYNPMQMAPAYPTGQPGQPVYNAAGQMIAPAPAPAYQTGQQFVQPAPTMPQQNFVPVNEFGAYGNTAQTGQQFVQPPVAAPVMTQQQAQASQQQTMQAATPPAPTVDVSTFNL